MFKIISEIKKVGFDKELNSITNKLPENKQICKDILKKLENEDVNIKENDSKQASLYLVFNNSILIANIKNSFTRVQTIAHECVHSTQNKKLLWFNFIFSNIYIIYFVAITIFALLNKTNNWIFAFSLLLAGFVFYIVRSYLEMDAMIKASYITQDYLRENSDVLTQKEIDILILKYDFINKYGIIISMLMLVWKCIFKLIVFGIVCLI